MDIKDHLHNFIVNNEALERFEVELKTFNPFSVLKVGSHEIRHSNVLAWLLDPSNNHSLGDRILKKIIMQVIVENEDVVTADLELQEIQLADFSDAFVSREENNIDILVKSHRNKFILLIENKIYSKESKGQLDKYLDTIKRSDPNYRVLPVLLTLQGDGPEGNTNYCIFSHKSIYNIVLLVSDLYKDYIPKAIHDFINYYLSTLREVLQMDEKIIALSKSIYREHKEALDTIFSIIKVDETAFSPAIDDFLKDNTDIFVTYSLAGGLWFLPNSIAEMPKVGRGNWNKGYPIALWFTKYYESLGFIVEIGPFNDPEQRVLFLNHLETHGFKIKDRSKKLESQYTRIYTKYINIKDWSNREEILEVMTDLYNNKAKQTIDNLLQAANSFTWQ